MTSYGRCLTPSDVAARISGPNYVLLRAGTFLRRHLASPIKPQAVMDGLLQPTCARSKAWIDHWCSGFLSIWLRVCMVCVLYALGKLFCSPNSNTHHHIKKGHATFAPIFCFGFTNGMYPTVRRLIVRILRYRWGYRAFDCLCFLFSCHGVQWWMQPWAFPFEILGLHPVLSVVVLFECMDGCLGLLLEAGVWTPKYKAIVPRSPHKWKLWTM